MRLSTVLTCAALAVALPVAGKLLSENGTLSKWQFDWSVLTSSPAPQKEGLELPARRRTMGVADQTEKKLNYMVEEEFYGLTEEEATQMVLAQLPPVDVPITQVCHELALAAEESGIPVPFFARLIWQESNFRQRVVSSAGAQGVAQFMPATAEEVGLDDPFDPTAALPASARYLQTQMRTFGNLGLAAAAYNAGARRVTEWLARKGPLPDETRNYVKSITGQEPEKWTEDDATIELAQHLPMRAPCEGIAGLSRIAETDTVPVTLEAPIAKVIADAREAEARAKAKLAKAKRTKEKFAKRKTSKHKIVKKKDGSKKTVKVADTGGRAAAKKSKLADAR